MRISVVVMVRGEPPSSRLRQQDDQLQLRVGQVARDVGRQVARALTMASQATPDWLRLKYW